MTISVQLQVLTEYFLVSVTSAVTVTVAGIVKEAVTILVYQNVIMFAVSILVPSCDCDLLRTNKLAGCGDIL